MTSFTNQGDLQHKAHSFGQSVKGITLEIFKPLTGQPEILVMAAIHGDESLSTVLLSECLRSLERHELKAGVILAANPDGILAGTRCNAAGVDLNRNYPAANWQPDLVYYRNHPDQPQDIPLSPGHQAGSEPETQAMIRLIESLQPSLIVSLHGFLGCIDDPDSSAVARDIARRTRLELVPDVGYQTPGSFGSWCAEQQIPIITYELPSIGIVEMKELHLPVLKDLMTGHYHNQPGQ